MGVAVGVAVGLWAVAAGQDEPPGPLPPPVEMASTESDDGDRAPHLLAAGDRETLWVCVDEPDETFRLLLRRPNTEPHVLWKDPGARWAGDPIALTGYERRAYLIYRDRTAQAFTFFMPVDPAQTPFETRQLPPLPHGCQLLSLAAGATGPVVFIRHPPTRSIDQPPSGASADPTEGSDDPTPPAPAAPGPQVELLVFDPTGWSTAPLPDAVQHAERLAVVMLDPDRDRWAIVTLNGGRLTVHQTDGEAWRAHAYPAPPSDDFQAIGLQRQIVIVHPAGDRQLAATMLRKGQAIDLGRIGLPENVETWTAVARGAMMEAVMIDRHGVVHHAMRDPATRPHGVTEPDVLRIATLPRPIDQSVLAMMLVFIAAMLILFAALRRGPAGNRVTLPPEMHATALSRRLIAAAIDLVPGVVVSMFVFGVGNPLTLFIAHWPGAARGEWTQMFPGAMAILVTVGHTAVGELFTGRSIGKRLVGSRVTTHTGKPPNLWQVLGRNGMKIMELIAYPMLVFMILSPYRQRLGDVVAQTVVVSDRPKPPTPTPDDEKTAPPTKQKCKEQDS